MLWTLYTLCTILGLLCLGAIIKMAYDDITQNPLT